MTTRYAEAMETASSRRRRVAGIGPCLCVGAITSVVVGWALWFVCGRNAGAVYFTPDVRTVDPTQWPVAVPKTWPAPVVHHELVAAGYVRGRWAGSNDTGGFTVTESATGWPLPCLSAASLKESLYGPPFGPPMKTTTQRQHSLWWNGVRTPFAFMASRPDEWAYLPVRPRWGAFALNTTIYAFPPWLLWRCLIWARRAVRLRGRRCPSCGYALVGLQPASPCPECGDPVPKLKPLNPSLLPGGAAWRRRRAARHIATQVTVCAALGVAATVAIAWGFAAFADMGRSRYSGPGRCAFLEARLARLGWQYSVFDRTGSTRVIVSEWGMLLAPDPSTPSLPAQVLRELRRAELEWRRNHRDPGWFVWDARGWPMPALSCRWMWWTWPGDQPPESVAGGIRLESWPTVRGFKQGALRALPLTPVWPGALVDAAIFGAAAWLLLFGIPLVLRARRRGSLTAPVR